MIAPMMDLGAFRMLAPRGRGGMAEVWEGVHVRSGLRVAIKVVSGPAAADGRLRRALEREVQAMARLSHPGIVRVLDHGVLPAGAPEGLVPGAPWFAMEWVDGTLEPWVGRLDWAPVRRILLRLLEALAHAHARGVLHRDVKPGNVLVEAVETWQLRLADFGIAHALDGTSAPLAAGTPAYMAPEQREGRWRRQGPWTDLFAVGRLASALLAPDARVPRGWPAWLARMCARDSWERPDFAAGARHALLRLGPGVALTDPPSDHPILAPTAPSSQRSVPDWAFQSTWVDFADAPAARDEEPLPATDEAPIPTSGWRDVHVRHGSAVFDAGLGLFHLREPDLVARIRERDAAWAELVGALRERAPRVVTLRGPEGVGRTRLGEWLCERAFELGLAWSYRVQGGASPGPIASIAAQALGVAGLGGTERVSLCEEVAAGHGWTGPGIGSMLAALSGGDLPVVDAVGTLTRLLSRIASRTPVVLFVDDAGEGEEQALAAELRERSDLGPILLVLAVRGRCRGAAGEIDLAPMPAHDLDEVVRQAIPLEPRLRDQVVAWAEGLPRVALDRLRSWALAGRLRPGPSGYTLDGEPEAGEGGGPWAARLDAFLASRSAADAAAVELGAFLGEVREDEWREVCARTGADAADLGAALGRAGLVRTTPEGGRFAHRSLAPLVVSRATAEAATRAHRACADVLAALKADPGRIGRHRLEAGDAAGALPLLATAARAALNRGAYALVRVWLQEWDRAAALAGVGPDDVRSVDGALIRLGLAQGELGDVPGAMAAGAELEARALRNGWAHVAWSAALIQGRLASMTGRLAEAEPHLLRARATARDASRAARCDHEIAVLLVRRGRYEEGEALLRRALATFVETGDAYMVSTVRIYLAHALTCAGRIEEAEALVDAGQAADDDSAPSVVSWLLLRGEIARRRGDWDGAEATYRQCAELAALSARWLPQISCIANIALCDIARGGYEAAQVGLEDALAAYRRLGQRHNEGGVHVFLLACAAATRDRTSWSLHLTAAEQRLGETGYVDDDVREGLERALALAGAAGFGADRERLTRLLAAQRL